MQWKALFILVIGCMVTQLSSSVGEVQTDSQSASIGYTLVFVSICASSAGGVISEKLLKDKNTQKSSVGETSIHWQNMQLYVFGLLFGVISLHMDVKSTWAWNRSVFDGLNLFAYGVVFTSVIAGLLISFILKYLDNVAKCFCAAFSMLCVAFLDSAMKRQMIPLRVVLGIILTALAVEQYNLS